MLEILKPAAQDSYAAYVAHLESCPRCAELKKRCEQGDVLVAVYLADARKP